jgi:hypothetical protein
MIVISGDCKACIARMSPECTDTWVQQSSVLYRAILEEDGHAAIKSSAKAP